MSDRAVAGTAVLVAIAAYLAPVVHVVVVAALIVAAMAVRMPTARAALVAAAVVVLVAGRAHDSIAALSAPLPGQVDGVAQLVADPESQLYGAQVVLRLDGRRYLAQTSLEDAPVLRTLLVGDRVAVVGRTAPLRGAPPGWVRSRHLAGRLQVSHIRAVPGTPPWYRVANVVHRTISTGAATLGEDHAALYLGVVLGDDRDQSDLTQFRFQASGLTHLLAVSGQNVAFVLAVFAPLLRRLGPRTQVVSGIVLLALFTLVTRGEPSVLRAAVMAAIVLTAIRMGRIAPGSRVLSMTVILLLVIDPLLVQSIGFQLSVAATTGLLFCARPLADRLPGPSWLRFPLGVTITAQLATAPILMTFTEGLPAAATPANLLAVPAGGIVMMLGVTVGAVAGLVREPVAHVLQLPSGLLVRWIDDVAAAASRSPLPMLGPGRLALVATALALGLIARRRRTPTEVAESADGRDGRDGREDDDVDAMLGATATRPRVRRWTRWARRSAGVVALVCLVLACRPMHPTVGPHDPADGARLVVGRCGGQVLAIGAVTDIGDLLQGLWQLGVRRIDLVVIEDRPSARRAAHVVIQQFAVRQMVTLAEKGPPGVIPLGDSTLTVGGVQAHRDAPRGVAPVISLSGAGCSF
ncbi:hypothetical protein BH10ACT3_BH10ACT3_01330 [soil metagenome]